MRAEAPTAPLNICGKPIPAEVVHEILTFVPISDLKVLPRVSKGLLSLATDPRLWTRFANNIINYRGKITMSALMKALSLPRFANLRHLEIPNGAKIGKQTVSKLAQIVPKLESFDFGFKVFRSGTGRLSYGVLSNLCESLPIKSLSFSLDYGELGHGAGANQGMAITIDFASLTPPSSQITETTLSFPSCAPLGPTSRLFACKAHLKAL